MSTPAILLDLQQAQPLRQLYYELARTLLAQGRAAEAGEFAQKAWREPGTTPPDWTLRYIEALSAQARQDASAALRALLDVAKLAPEHIAEVLPPARTLLTKHVAGLEPSWLHSELTALLAQDGLSVVSRAEVLFLLGQVQAFTGDWAQARASLAQARTLTPDNIQILESLAEVLQQAGETEPAVATLREALAKSGAATTQSLRLKVSLARTLLVQQRYDDALAELADDEDASAELALLRGQVLLAKGQWRAALVAAENVLQNVPETLAAHLLKIQALLGLHCYKQANSAITLALRYDPSNADLTFFKVQALVEGQTDLAHAERLLADYCEDAGLAGLRAQLMAPALLARQADGNARYFQAQVYCWRSADWPPAQALQEVEAALDLGLSADADAEAETNPAGAAWELKGKILAAEAQNIAAAQAFFEAGRSAYWDGEYKRAQGLFQQAHSLDVAVQEVYWYLADCFYLLAASQVPPYYTEAELQQALTWWQRGQALGQPDAATSWAFITRGRINSGFARLVGYDPMALQWEATLYLERAILLNDEEENRWADLAILCRDLLLDNVGLHAADRALHINPDSLFALETRAAALLNLGRDEESDIALAELRKRAPGPVYDSWLAIIRFYQRNYEAAIELLNESVEEDNLWARAQRASCFLCLERLEDAHNDFAWIWERRTDPAYATNENSFPWAAFWLGLLDEARARYDALLAKPEEALNAQLKLCFCELAAGRLPEARAHWSAGLALAKSARDFDFEEVLLAQLETLAAREQWPHAAAVSALIHGEDGLLAMAVARRTELLRQPFTARRELERWLTLPQAPARGSDAWLAVHAELGRFCHEEGDWLAAFEAYSVLLPYAEKIPEAHLGLEKTCASLTPAHYWQLRDHLSEMFARTGASAQVQATVRTALETVLPSAYRLAAAQDWWPMVTPLAVELSPKLVPEDTSAEWVLFKTYIPEMRARLQQEMGLIVPSVRVRVNEGDLPEDGYLILLHDVPVVMGALPSGRAFCPAPIAQLRALGIPDTALLAATHPDGVTPGCWVESSFVGLIQAQGMTVWPDEWAFLVQHLEALLRVALAEFLGEQEVADWLTRQAQSGVSAELIAAAIPDDLRRLRLGRVLRALLAEQVSIADGQAILTAVREVGLPQDDVQSVVSAVRLRLKAMLPGNRPTDELITVPPALEQSIPPYLSAHGGKLYLTVPPTQTQELLAEFRSLLETDGPGKVLVVNDTVVRPFVRRLLEVEFPQVMVVAQAELLPRATAVERVREHR